MSGTFNTPRPLSVSIIGWFLLATGAVTILYIPWILRAPVEVADTYREMGVDPRMIAISTIVGALVSLGAGYAILHGLMWGRTLYLSYLILSSIAGVLIIGSGWAGAIVSLVVFAIIATLLTRAPAQAYFDGTYELTEDERERSRIMAAIRTAQRNRSDVAQVFGILFAVGAGFMILMAVFMFGIGAGSIGAAASLFFGIPGCMALGIGLILWGHQRWAGFIGWALAATGAFCAMGGLGMLAGMQTEYFENAMAASSNYSEMPFEPGAFVVIGLFGLLITVAGGLLIYLQSVRDKEAFQAASRDVSE